MLLNVKILNKTGSKVGDLVERISFLPEGDIELQLFDWFYLEESDEFIKSVDLIPFVLNLEFFKKK